LLADDNDSASSCHQLLAYVFVNPLTPNDHYSGRTAPLTSKRFILYIYLTNILNMVYILRFFLFKMQFVS